MDYQSAITIESKSFPGVAFTILRMSFGRRIELIRRVREAAARVEFLEAGSDPREKIEAALLGSEIDRLYLLWGLAKIEGLTVDGEPATTESLAAAGPEALAREIVAAIKAESGLSEDERKNSWSPSISSLRTRPDGSATNAGETASRSSAGADGCQRQC
jgi:hypothetical protein